MWFYKAFMQQFFFPLFQKYFFFLRILHLFLKYHPMKWHPLNSVIYKSTGIISLSMFFLPFKCLKQRSTTTFGAGNAQTIEIRSHLPSSWWCWNPLCEGVSVRAEGLNSKVWLWQPLPQKVILTISFGSSLGGVSEPTLSHSTTAPSASISLLFCFFLWLPVSLQVAQRLVKQPTLPFSAHLRVPGKTSPFEAEPDARNNSPYVDFHTSLGWLHLIIWFSLHQFCLCECVHVCLCVCGFFLAGLKSLWPK